MRIALVNAPLQSAVCDYGVGHQIPLGLLMVGGPLIDAGFVVTLIDAARLHLDQAAIVEHVADFAADVVMIAHVGSTSAHPCCIRVLCAIKAKLPHVITIYGGVHPTYHYKTILAQHSEIDIIVRGEGEATVLELMHTLAQQRNNLLRPSCHFDLSHVNGIAWRHTDTVSVTSARMPIQHLDEYRIGWELIDDWDRYRAFGLGRAAVVQFSRGCPHTCTYCGQWMFWKRWRHRDVIAFVDELAWLHQQHNIRFFWLADENPTTSKTVWKELLSEISRRKLPIGLCASIRTQDIVRDADILPLYRQAGFLYILMGVETVTDATLDKIRKGSSVDDAYQAVRLLRAHNIMSIVDYIFGIEDETPHTIARALRGLLDYDGDFVNALYLTPHAWTPLGRDMQDTPVIESDLSRWDYRHQVTAVPHLSPTQLFFGVKLVEMLYHLHPRRLWRIITAPDQRLRQQLRFTFLHTSLVFWYEIYEHIRNQLRTAHQRDHHRQESADYAEKPNALL